MPKNACGARQPGWESGPAIGRHRIPCVLDTGHMDDHANAFGDKWENDAERNEEWQDAWAEVLSELMYALAEQVRGGRVTLGTAAQIYSQTSAGAFGVDYATQYLTDIVAEEMLSELGN